MGKLDTRKDGPGRAVLDRAYAIARDKFPREVHLFASFRRFIGATSQNINTWVERGVPAARLLAISTKLGVPVELLRGEEPRTTTTDLGELLTNEEAMMLAAFRQADEATRQKMLALARSALVAKLPADSPRAIPIRR
jgi:hypothetical protein